MSAFTRLELELRARPRRWAITGVAGFIGSHLLEQLLRFDQTVSGLDNFATGHPRNLESVQRAVTPEQWARFSFTSGDAGQMGECERWLGAPGRVDCLLHQAALGSVPRSIADPVASNQANVVGFLNMLTAARAAGVGRVVYASSSSVYGDHPDLPKVEARIGQPLSPYAITKLVNELYAETFARNLGFPSIGLRYFNVFGPRQDANGSYAAVIPKWITQMLQREPTIINGDGETSRDFCFIRNVVEANLLAATTTAPAAVNQVYNIAAGDRTTLGELHHKLGELVRELCPPLQPPPPLHHDFRSGDVRHSLASLEKAAALLGFAPTISVDAGLRQTVAWYAAQRAR